MKVLLQRVTEASVVVDGERIGEIEHGFMLLVGFGEGDDASVVEPMAKRVANIRVLEDENGRFQFALNDKGYAVLAVPQFTLYARTTKGRRPDFTQALAPAQATELFDQFVDALKAKDIARVETGRFGADMKVSLINDGPVTVMLDSAD